MFDGGHDRIPIVDVGRPGGSTYYRCNSIGQCDPVTFYLLLELFRAHLGEQQHLLDGWVVGEQHYQAVHADADA